MKVRAAAFLFSLLVVGLLAGCVGGETQATIPPPPTPLGNQPPLVVTIGQSTAVPQQLETAVAQSSPTPFETPTLAPTVTPQAQPADPQSQAATAGNLPAASHDLLFIADGALKRWQGAARQVVTLVAGGDEAASVAKRGPDMPPIVGDVAAYALSQDGRRAAVARLTASTPISNTATAVTVTIQTYELSYLNLETGERRVLVPAVTDVGNLAFALSRDGRHLAFGGLGLGEAGSLALTAEPQGALFVLETETGAPPKTIGGCATRCHDFVWHQDNNFFVFGDGGGLFLYNLSASKPELLAGDPAITRYYGPISWAKNGRWLLMWLGLGIEGADKAILDVPTKQAMTIPNTFQYADPLYAEVAWMQDDRLFVVRAEGPDGPAIGETWRVDVEGGQVVRDESVVLSASIAHPTAPVHWADGRFGYGLIDENGAAGTGLFRRTAFNEPEERLNDMPAALFAPEAAWLPDGSGAALAQAGRLYYAPAGGSLYDMQPVVGRWAHALSWLP